MVLPLCWLKSQGWGFYWAQVRPSGCGVIVRHLRRIVEGEEVSNREGAADWWPSWLYSSAVCCKVVGKGHLKIFLQRWVNEAQWKKNSVRIWQRHRKLMWSNNGG